MKYNKIKELGQGGFAKVFEVIDQNNERCAMKEFHLHPSMAGLEEIAKKRFIKEAIYQQQLEHPNIVQIFELNDSVDPPFYTMELADSSMEKDIMDNYLSKDNYLNCIYDIMAGLEEMHDYGMYHRDLKPANVLRYEDSYAIGDFGLISLNKTGITTLTSTGMAKSSDFYTAPEITQDLKHASIQSDIFSLGCLLHDFVGVSSRIPCNEITENSAFGDLLLSATRKDPRRRFSSVKSFREALLSINQSDIKANTEGANEIIDLLAKPISTFNESDVTLIVDFLNSNVVESEKHTILKTMSLEKIEYMVANSPNASYVGKHFFEYVRNGSFEWDFCDPLASRVIAFMEIDELDIKSEGAFALLYMGTSHNRWYVERKAIKFFQGDIDNKLLKRMTMEMRVDGRKFCRALDHLIHSINQNINNFHPEIQKLYHTIC